VYITKEAFFDISATTVDATCGSSNGSINLAVTGGGPGTYTYLWSNGATTQDLSNIPAGTYTVTVTSPGGPGGGCSDNFTVVVNNLVDFEITATITDDYCNNGTGSIDQTVVFGSGLTFNWSTGATTEDVSGLVEGTYTCTVDFPSGCTQTYSYDVGNQTNGTIVQANVQNEMCLDGNGSIDLTLTGGTGPFDFSWSSSEITEDISGLSQGTFVVTIVDQNDGCTFSETYDIVNDVTIFNATSIVTHSTCATCTEGNINVIIANSSNYTFDWSTGASTEDVSGLTPGTYSVLITSAEGCDTTMTFTVLNTAGLDEEKASLIAMEIYPNPATTSFSIELTVPEGQEGQLLITDVLGKVISTDVITQSGIVNIKTNKMNDGVYFVTLKIGNYSKMERVAVSNE